MPRQNSRDAKTNLKTLLGEALKKLRLDAGFATQGAFAARLSGWGEDTVSKVETGTQLPTDDMLTRWLDLCAPTDRERQHLTSLLGHARESTRGSGVPEFARPWFEAEAEAEFLHIWNDKVVPGLVQVEEYAQEMYDLPGIDRDWAAETVAFRMQRQAILSGDDPVQVSIVLDESVLYMLMGTPAIMVKQLDRLLATSMLPNVTIQIARGKGAYWGLSGPFQIASAHGKPDTLLMSAFEDVTSGDPALTRKAAILFEKIRANALNVEDSRGAMTEARDHWESQQN